MFLSFFWIVLLLGHCGRGLVTSALFEFLSSLPLFSVVSSKDCEAGEAAALSRDTSPWSREARGEFPINSRDSGVEPREQPTCSVSLSRATCAMVEPSTRGEIVCCEIFITFSSLLISSSFPKSTTLSYSTKSCSIGKLPSSDVVLLGMLLTMRAWWRPLCISSVVSSW